MIDPAIIPAKAGYRLCFCTHRRSDQPSAHDYKSALVFSRRPPAATLLRFKSLHRSPARSVMLFAPPFAALCKHLPAKSPPSLLHGSPGYCGANELRNDRFHWLARTVPRASIAILMFSFWYCPLQNRQQGRPPAAAKVGNTTVAFGTCSHVNKANTLGYKSVLVLSCRPSATGKNCTQ